MTAILPIQPTREVFARTRQRQWQLNRQAQGCCIICGKPKEPERANKLRCFTCQKKDNLNHEVQEFRALVKRSELHNATAGNAVQASA